MSDQNQESEPSADHSPSPPNQVKPFRLASLRRDPKGWLIALFGVGAPLAFIIAAGGSGIGLWARQAGLAAVPWIILMAMAALLLAIAFIVLNRRQGRETRWPLIGLGMAAALGFLAYLAPYGSAMLSLACYSRHHHRPC